MTATYAEHIINELEKGGTTALQELIAAHELDITCPWCKAEPKQRCHVIFEPERVVYRVHAARTAHLRALWHAGYQRGWKAAQDVAQAAS